jgi:hypothetical protein
MIFLTVVVKKRPEMNTIANGPVKDAEQTCWHPFGASSHRLKFKQSNSGAKMSAF